VPAAREAAAKGRTVDVLGELEKLRREAMQKSTPTTAVTAQSRPATAVTAPPHPPTAPAPSSNGRGEMTRTIELTLKRSDFRRARRFRVSFQVEDEQQQVMDAVRDLQLELKELGGLEKLLLHLNIAVNTKE
jgi:hypothetical protein